MADQHEASIIDREIDEQSYQWSWADDEDAKDGSVSLLCKDDSNDESQIILTQAELLQMLQDGMMFLRTRKILS